MGIMAFLQIIPGEIKGKNEELPKEDSDNSNHPGKAFPKDLAYSYVEGKRVNTYYVEKEDADKLTFHEKHVGYKSQTQRHSVPEFFSKLDDNWLSIVVFSVSGFVPTSASINDIVYYVPDPKVLRECDFILGAGTDIDFSIGNWKTLVNNIESEIINRLTCTSKELKDFEGDLCNTNYIAPQILMDMDSNVYRKTIYDTLYKGGYNPAFSNLSKPIDNTNLYQVARIAAHRKRPTQILTFNYDDVLETLIASFFKGTTYNSAYKGSRKPLSTPNIEVVHSHGFLPLHGKTRKHDLVFSSYEYMEAYRRSNSYARKKLSEQLKHTNILVGNSLADYEEQKVFYINHQRNLSHYDYLFLRKHTKDWMNHYIYIYFIKMGVIPVFFDTFDTMNTYLKAL